MYDVYIWKTRSITSKSSEVFEIIRKYMETEIVEKKRNRQIKEIIYLVGKTNKVRYR